MKTEYSKTREQFRAEQVDLLARYKRQDPQQVAAELLPTVVSGEWLAEIRGALVRRQRLSPEVLRGLAQVFSIGIFDFLAGGFSDYDWSYAQPVIDAIKAEAAA